MDRNPGLVQGIIQFVERLLRESPNADVRPDNLGFGAFRVGGSLTKWPRADSGKRRLRAVLKRDE